MSRVPDGPAHDATEDAVHGSRADPPGGGQVGRGAGGALLLLPRVAIARPRATIAAVFVATLAALPGLSRLQLRTDGHALVPPDDPAVGIDAAIRARFGLLDPIVLYLQTSRPEGILNPDSLARLAALTQAVQKLSGIPPEQVMSLATERRDRVYSGTLRFRPFLDPPPTTPQEIETLRGDIEAAGILTGTLVSRDGRAATVLVGVPAGHPAGGEPQADRRALCERVAQVARGFETSTDRVLVVGAPVAESLLGTHIIEDLRVQVPLAMVVMSLVVWYAFRRLWGVALGLIEVGACLAFTFGVMGWLGSPVYLTTSVLPVILTTIALADEIHVFSTYQRCLRTLPADAPAARVARLTMDEITRPIVLTSLTTAIGFLSFLGGTIEPIQSFGRYAAVGILYGMLYSLTVVPASLTLIAPRHRAAAAFVPVSGGPLLRGFGAALRARRVTLVVIGIGTLAVAAGIPRLRVQDSWIDGFAAGSPFRTATEHVHANLLGTHLLLVELAYAPTAGVEFQSGRRAGPLLSAATLNDVGRFEEFVRRQPGVGGVLGPYSHLVAVAHMAKGRSGPRRLPEEPRDIATVYDRFDMVRGIQRRRQVVADDLRHGVVTVFLKNANYRDTERLIRAIREYAEARMSPRPAAVRFGGDVAVSQAMIPAIVRSQVASLLGALGGDVVAICALTLSLSTGLACALPAVLAVLWTFGWMGWSGIPLGVATSMFCAITLGIAVDYGIHFMSRYSAARRRQPCAPNAGSVAPAESPAAAALRESGPAIVADALAVACGFGLLSLSQVPASARLGVLIAVALLTSCVFTLAGLSALLAERSESSPAGAGPGA